MAVPTTASLITICSEIGSALRLRAAEVLAGAFPGIALKEISRLEEAPAAGAADGSEVLVLCEPTVETWLAACAATDEARLPRWALVLLGSPPVGVAVEPFVVVAAADWTAPLAQRVIQAAIGLQRVQRENARLRGDLATFGFRIAHDLRTPLGGVVTTAEMAKEILADGAPDQAALMQPVLDSADELVKLVERMSFIAKAISTADAPQRFNMATPFWNAFQQLESQLLSLKAELIQPAEWPIVRGHSAWLEVIWRNLLVNAVERAGRGARIEAGWSADRGENRFWLRDSGAVSPERRSTLFFPFHRLREPEAPRGLDLPIVQRLVELLGGRCGFVAPPEGGTCLYFTLPVEPAVQD